MTAHAMNGDRERYLASGMDGYLSKPIDQVALFAAVEAQPPGTPAEFNATLPESGSLDVAEMRQRLGDDDLVAEVIELFLSDLPVRLAHIGAAVAARDVDAIRTAAHALKGAAGNLAATPIVECAKALERLADSGTITPALADVAWVRLQAEGDRLTAALHGVVVPSRIAE
jgi:HPt (histidine-containing phosphotransfer) domain-containing protein